MVVEVECKEVEVDGTVEGEYRKMYLRVPRKPLGGANLLLEARSSCDETPKMERGKKVRAAPERRRVRTVSWKGRSVLQLG